MVKQNSNMAALGGSPMDILVGLNIIDTINTGKMPGTIAIGRKTYQEFMNMATIDRVVIGPGDGSGQIRFGSYSSSQSNVYQLEDQPTVLRGSPGGLARGPAYEFHATNVTLPKDIEYEHVPVDDYLSKIKKAWKD